MTAIAEGLILIGFVAGVALLVTVVCLVRLFDIGQAKMEEVDRLAGREPAKYRIRAVLFAGFVDSLRRYRDATKRAEDKDS